MRAFTILLFAALVTKPFCSGAINGQQLSAARDSLHLTRKSPGRAHLGANAGSIVDVDIDLFKSCKNYRKDPDVKVVVDGIKELAIRLIKKLVPTRGKMNTVLSPASLSKVIAMIWLGARGRTALQMNQELYLPYDIKVLLKGFCKLRKYFEKCSNGYTLAFANRLYIDNEVKVKPEFEAQIRRICNSEPGRVDFTQKEAAVANINGWVEGTTHENITNFLSADDVPDKTSVLVISGVNFKGALNCKSNHKMTYRTNFHVSEDTAEDIPNVYMKCVRCQMKYKNDRDLGAEIVAVPFEGEGLYLLVIIPHEVKGMSAVLRNLNSVQIEKFLKDKKKKEVNLCMHRLNTTSLLKLSEAFKDLGVKDLFDADAVDLHSMSEDNKPVSEVVQKTSFKLNVYGDQANNGLIDGLVQNVVPSRAGVVDVLADHPFIYITYDEGIGMFRSIGAMNDPSSG